MRPALAVAAAVLLAPLALLALAPAARAEDPSPAQAQMTGRWRTIDDETKKPKSIVNVYEEGGKLFGRIEKLLDPPPGEPDPRCKKCEGALKDQPIVGMRIMWDFKPDGSGGRILDPKNGKVYKCKLALADQGKKLDVRGYVGIPMLGRTQTWERAE